ncbi:peptidase domain-containing ABC transporter [Epilithonimonas hominis]|uniref:peptidase domain-containing ABC transporter n=1 Tax=Epilithonimonas hominis TaxID=420404 RepID=UPI00289AEF99|nr:peptidase domain-containing ABC transporter [Epilithonimonas hominis]
MVKKKFPFYKQPDTKDCGPTCLRIISKFYGKNLSLQYIRDLAETTRQGSSLMGLSEAAEKLGFRTVGAQIDYLTLEQIPLPCIVYWNRTHFVVVYNIKNDTVYVSDPAYGLITYTKDDFIRNWIGNNSKETDEGIVLALEPTPQFQENDWETSSDKKRTFFFILKYLSKYKSLAFQIFLGLLIGTLLALILPFLTQSVVDIGIQNQNLNFIYLVLMGQIMIFIGNSCLEVIRGWILLHLSTRINISLISDFFIKLMNLPISFFDTRVTGDIMQRISDQNRIEQVLTNSSLSTIFSLVNIITLNIVLLYYNYKLSLVYIIASIIYILWIIIFFKKRSKIDYQNFAQLSQEQSKVIELINGMQEIKMHNAERQKRWEWESLQVKLFKIKIKFLRIEQFQSIGGNFINQIKDIIVTFISAKLVVQGEITLGMMLSVQFIVGQLNSPLTQLITFIQQLQDAQISLDRLNEIHEKDDEENALNQNSNVSQSDIIIENMSFRYSGSNNFVFKNLNVIIPFQKTTAIVGTSGSGKTTLLKLIMKFYDPNEGEIKIGNTSLKNISPKFWRNQCGVVMQDGYIFNDTIAKNISIGEEYVDKDKLKFAVEVANIKEFIESLPLSYNTGIGNEGIGISGGQQQRLFIARAIYKSPEYIFFDEATSALDANNEKVIMENLEQFFKGRTAIVIAHRLSTVKNADKIIVLDKGKIVEEGNHEELVNLRGEYFKLVKNQLELGN